MIKLSDCEIYIMHVIWTNEETTSFDILDKVKEDKKLSENTVRTLLARMVKKKAIYISSKTGKTYTYKVNTSKNLQKTSFNKGGGTRRVTEGS